MGNIKEKFGTGWIGTGSGSESDRTAEADRPRGPGTANATTRGYEPRNYGSTGSGTGGSYSGSGTGDSVNQVFLTLGKQMIRFLRETDGTDKLYNLADKMKLGPEDCAPVVEWLANNYYVRVEPDKFGNHQISLTGRADELA